MHIIKCFQKVLIYPWKEIRFILWLFAFFYKKLSLFSNNSRSEMRRMRILSQLVKIFSGILGIVREVEWCFRPLDEHNDRWDRKDLRFLTYSNFIIPWNTYIDTPLASTFIDFSSLNWFYHTVIAPVNRAYQKVNYLVSPYLWMELEQLDKKQVHLICNSPDAAHATVCHCIALGGLVLVSLELTSLNCVIFLFLLKF